MEPVGFHGGFDLQILHTSSSAVAVLDVADGATALEVSADEDNLD